MAYKERLKELREFRKMTRKELATLLNVSPAMITNYEKGYSSPPMDILIKTAEILGCDLNYLFQDELKVDPITFTTSQIEQKLIKKYRRISKRDRVVIDQIIDIFYSNRLKLEEATNDRLMEIPEIAAQGYPDGNILMMVFGDSAEPLYKDGRILVIHPQDALVSGDIGVFEYEGRDIIRRYQGDFLEPLNELYEDIPINKRNKPKVIGKVVGKI